MTINTLEILGYIFIFYIGFYFFRLAENFNKNKWIFGFIGILSYVLGYFLYIMFCRFSYSQDEILESLHLISIKSFISGTVSAIIIFQVLSRVWSKKKNPKNEVDKIGEDNPLEK